MFKYDLIIPGVHNREVIIKNHRGPIIPRIGDSFQYNLRQADGTELQEPPIYTVIDVRHVLIKKEERATLEEKVERIVVVLGNKNSH